jgi:hypothetical protein
MMAVNKSRKNEIMKTSTIKRMAAAACVAAALAMVAGCATNGSGSSTYKAPTTAKGGAAGLMQLQPLKTGEDVAKLEVGDAVVMACPKCKSTYVTRITPENKPRQTSKVGVELHDCPGCATEIKTHGHGKTAKDVVTHVCKNCGSTDAYCCVMKAGQGPTKGMK